MGFGPVSGKMTASVDDDFLVATMGAIYINLG